MQQVPITWYNICWVQGHYCYLIQSKFLSGRLYFNGFCFPKAAAIFLLKAHVDKILGDSVLTFSLVPDALYRIYFLSLKVIQAVTFEGSHHSNWRDWKKILCWNLFRASRIFHWSIWYWPCSKNTDDRSGGLQCGTLSTSSLYLMGDKTLRTFEVYSGWTTA